MEETEVYHDLPDDGEKFVSYKLENSSTHHEQQLRNLVTSWTELKPDVCFITEDHQRVFTQRILLSLHSRSLCALLRDSHQSDLQIISIPVTGKSLRNLMRLLVTGVAVSASREELKETEKVANILRIPLSRSIIKKLKIPSSDVLSYSKIPVKIKIDNIKPNMIEMTNPCVDDLDILGILDQEIEIVDSIIRAEPDPMEQFPNTKMFRTKTFTEQIERLKGSGLRFQRLESELICLTENTAGFQFPAPKVEPTDEFTPGFLLSDDISSSQSDSGSVTLTERKLPKRKLYLEDSEPRELPEISARKRPRLSVSDMETFNSAQRFNHGSCECGQANLPARRPQESPRTPRTPLQRELYNSCDDCIRRRADENIKSIKQRKYFQMLKDKRAEAEKYKGQRFPCEKCDYVAAIPSNLKTHQMANHDGENFVDKYINDYFEKNKFLIL